MTRSVGGILLAAALFLTACDLPLNESVVGSSGDTQIQGVLITVDTTFVAASPDRLVGRGRARNNGSGAISSPWYVEAQFYTDVSYRTKLGGNYTTIYVPLSRGQETIWTISLSSSNVDVRQYPNFRLGDLRAIYKN